MTARKAKPVTRAELEKPLTLAEERKLDRVVKMMRNHIVANKNWERIRRKIRRIAELLKEGSENV